MGTAFQVTLEIIGQVSDGLRFRVAFDSSAKRWLLPYPRVTGLRFVALNDRESPEWGTRYLVSRPQDEFVLNPNHRIAFDLAANVNASEENYRWTIKLPPAEYDVQYTYKIDSGEARYDYLGKGSRFADLTPPWVGVCESNTVQVSLGAARVRS